MCEWLLLIELQQIQNREKKDPDEIDEVPEKTGDLDAVGETFRFRAPHLCACPPQERDHERSAENVQGVQGGEGKVNAKVSAVRGHKGGQALDFRDGNFDGRLYEYAQWRMRHLQPAQPDEAEIADLRGYSAETLKYGTTSL